MATETSTNDTNDVTSEQTEAFVSATYEQTEAFVSATYERLRVAPEFVLTSGERALRNRLGDDDEAWDALRAVLVDTYEGGLAR